MQAYVLERYGSTKDLSLKEIDKPQIGDEEVLIRMMFTSLNAADLDYVHGHPLVRFTGLRRPGIPVLGSDVIGSVAEVGMNVQGFALGDLVWADSSDFGYGTFAEYIKAPAKSILKLPDHIPLEDACCLPTASMVALQNVKIKYPLSAKQNGISKASLKAPGEFTGLRVLVNGAGGGIGTILVQLLKYQGAYVTAVDKGEKLPLLEKLGADRVLDYEETNYTKAERDYDILYDLVCSEPLNDCRRVLKKDGLFIMLGGTTKNMLKVFIFGPLLSLFWGQKVKMGRWETNNLGDLRQLASLYQQGAIKPVIHKVLPFQELISGLRQLEEGSVLGKLVIDYSKGSRE